MRHRKADKKLGRSPAHREALMASLVCGLIEEKRIKTTLVKAKQARQLAEKAVTLARRGTLAARRQLIGILRREERVTLLFDKVVPQLEGRASGFTRITKLGCRRGDGSDMAFLEWVGIAPADKKRKAKKTEETKPEEKK